MKSIKTFLFSLTIASSAFLNAQTAQVQVIHNSADLAADTVDVWLDDVLTLDDVAFRTATAFLSIPSNVAFDVTIQPSNSIDTIGGLYRETFNLDSNETYVMIANGIISATGYTPNEAFSLDVFQMARDTSLNGAAEVDVLVFHGSTDAPAVDIFESSVPAGTLVDNASYGDFAGYLSLDTGDYVVQVRDSSNSKILAAYSAPLATLNAGGLALTVVASGFLDSTQNSNGASFGLFAATPAGGNLIELPAVDIPTARVQVIHNSPDLAAEFVDVWLNDAPLLNNFEFRTASPFVDLQAGVPFVVSISDSASTDTTGAVAQVTYNLEEDSTYVIIANGIVSATGYTPNEPFSLDVFGSGQETSNAGAAEVDVLVFHGSTDAPTVDIYESSVPAGTLVDNASYGDYAGYLALDTGDYIIEVRNETNSAIVAAYSAPLATLNTGGSALTVVASGFLDSTQNLNGASFGLFAATPSGGALIELPSVAIPTARIQAVHNCSDDAAEFVDVWLNDTPLIDNFEFRTASPFVDVQAGVPFVLSIADSGSTDTTSAVAQFTYSLAADSTYQLIAAGIVSQTGYSPSPAFDIHVFGSARESSGSSTETDVLVYHGSTDAPAVDVDETSVPAGNLVDSASYSEFAGYLTLNTADYTIDVIDATNSTVLVSYSVPLNTLNLGGEALTVVASGFVDPSVNSSGPAFGLWATSAAGGALLQLPIATSIIELDNSLDNSISMYPNPSNGNIQIEFDGSDEIPQLIEVLDLTGKKIKEIGLQNSYYQNLDLTDLPKGPYLMKIIGNEKIAVRRVILQ